MTSRELQAERLNRGFSRRALAREIDVPEQTLRRVEADLRISPHYAKRIADYFGIRVTDLPQFVEQAAA